MDKDDTRLAVRALVSIEARMQPIQARLNRLFDELHEVELELSALEHERQHILDTHAVAFGRTEIH